MVRRGASLIGRLASRSLFAAMGGSLLLSGIVPMLVVVVIVVSAVAKVVEALGADQVRLTGSGTLVCGTSDAGRESIPTELMTIYEAAAAHYDLGERGVFVLAAINKVETDFGRNVAVSSAGAVGWMQFMPATWAAYGVDVDGGGADPSNPQDAIFSAANYLASSGASRGLWYRAIFAYNHADWYVREVLAYADAWTGRCVQAATLDVGEATVGEVLANPRITLSDSQRADLLRGSIDPRVVATLAAIGKRHTVIVTALESDHRPGGNHPLGRAVDLDIVDGTDCGGSRQGPCADLVRELAAVEGPLRSTELIYCWDPDGPNDPRGFARSDHCNHVHVGWDLPMTGPTPR